MQEIQNTNLGVTLCRDTARTDRVRHKIYEVELETGEILSSIVKNRQEWDSPKYIVIPLHESIVREGVPI
jgi:uncharacterized protein